MFPRPGSIDERFAPEPAYQGAARTPATHLRVYESSVADAVTVITYDPDAHNYAIRGLRLTREQVARLHTALGDYLNGSRAHVPQEDEGVETKAARVLWETSRRDEGTISATGADIAARALADAGLLVSEDARGALAETLDDLTRTLARAEKAEAEVARYQRLVSWHEWHGSDAEARARRAEDWQREVCDIAERVDAYFAGDGIPKEVLWPCATAAALASIKGRAS